MCTSCTTWCGCMCTSCTTWCGYARHACNATWQEWEQGRGQEHTMSKCVHGRPPVPHPLTPAALAPTPPHPPHPTPAFDLVCQVLQHRACYGRSIHGGCAPAQLVQDHQGAGEGGRGSGQEGSGQQGGRLSPQAAKWTYRCRGRKKQGLPGGDSPQNGFHPKLKDQLAPHAKTCSSHTQPLFHPTTGIKK